MVDCCICMYLSIFLTHPKTPTGLITPSNSITAYENWPPSNVSISFTQPLLWYDGRRGGWMVVKELGRGRSWYLQTATPRNVAKSTLAALWARLPRHDTSDNASPQVPWQWLTFCQICISEIWCGCTFSGAWRDWAAAGILLRQCRSGKEWTLGFCRALTSDWSTCTLASTKSMDSRPSWLCLTS